MIVVFSTLIIRQAIFIFQQFCGHDTPLSLRISNLRILLVIAFYECEGLNSIIEVQLQLGVKCGDWSIALVTFTFLVPSVN